jgi:hypothetical protein
MKALQGIFFLLLFAGVKTVAQKHDPTHLINYLIKHLPLDSIGYLQQPLLVGAINGFLQQHDIDASDSIEIKKQLLKPLRKIRPSRIKDAKIYTSIALANLKAEVRKAYDGKLAFFTFSHPVFLSGNRIWIKIELFCGILCSKGWSLFLQQKASNYQLLKSKMIWTG